MNLPDLETINSHSGTQGVACLGIVVFHSTDPIRLRAPQHLKNINKTNAQKELKYDFRLGHLPSSARFYLKFEKPFSKSVHAKILLCTSQLRVPSSLQPTDRVLHRPPSPQATRHHRDPQSALLRTRLPNKVKSMEQVYSL